MDFDESLWMGGKWPKAQPLKFFGSLVEDLDPEFLNLDPEFFKDVCIIYTKSVEFTRWQHYSRRRFEISDRFLLQ